MNRRLLWLRACAWRSWWGLLLVALAFSVVAPTRAQETLAQEAATEAPNPGASATPSASDDKPRPSTERAKEWFKAGAAAYAAGDYRAAIQALEAAYELTPLPPIAFSIAQAERRQFFVERSPEHLTRSVALFRRYLDEVPNGGRRADAIEALSQLEPMLAQTQTSAAPAPVAPDRATRIMVLCDVPNARISVDGVESAPSPLIREVTPGRHEVKVRAPGYRDGQRHVVAVEGELVPITVSLAELPSRLQLSMPEGAELYVDGVLVSHGPSQLELELPSGRHRVSVAEKGHRVSTQSLLLERGQTGTASFQLEPTRQRLASHVLFLGGAAALATGGAFGFLALRAENQAQGFLERHERGNMSPGELVRYNADVATRNRYRWLAGSAFGSALGLLVTGLFLHELDTPGAEELVRSLPRRDGPLATSTERSRQHFDLGTLLAPGQFGASLRGEF